MQSALSQTKDPLYATPRCHASLRHVDSLTLTLSCLVDCDLAHGIWIWYIPCISYVMFALALACYIAICCLKIPYTKMYILCIIIALYYIILHLPVYMFIYFCYTYM